MRGQGKMKRGQTIVAEREQAESESERLQERRRIHRKRRNSVISAIVILGALGVLAYITGKNAMMEYETGKAQEEEYIIRVKIVDEDNRGQISTRTKNYIAQLEQDMRDLGYTITQVVLPTGTSRELYVDVEGIETYLKVNTDRDTAVTAEDADRVLRYLGERDLKPAYVDIRVEGRAYYK